MLSFALSFLLLAPSLGAEAEAAFLGPASSDSSEQVVDCSKVKCRLPHTLTLVEAAGRRYTVEIPRGPIVRGDMLTLVVGETFVIDGIRSEAALTDLRIVEESSEPPGALMVSFGQDLQREGPPLTYLWIENRLSKLVRFQATILSPGAARAASTTVCDVAPGKTSYEMWPSAIQEIRLFDFRLVEWKEGDRLRCR